MASWRRRAIALFPELRVELEDPASTPYTLFMELLPRVVDAHSASNDRELQRIYGYADWCMRQKSKELWNPAAVSFFEHVFDRWDLRTQVLPWLSPTTIAECWSLWQERLTQAQLSEIQRLLQHRKSLRYQDFAAT